MRFCSNDDEHCEHLFSVTVSRQSDVRHMVRLKLSRVSTFADSRSIAVSCLLWSRRRRQREPELDFNYVNFMEEYIQLRHMVPLPDGKIHREHVFHLPHRPVFWSDVSRKIRMVFNASQRCHLICLPTTAYYQVISCKLVF